MYYTDGMKKMGRPRTPPSQIRNRIINLRVTRSEQVDLRRKAGKNSVTDYIRDRVFPPPHHP